MTELEQLVIPPTELEIAELASAVTKPDYALSTKGVLIIRRLAFDRGRLTDMVRRVRELIGDWRAASNVMSAADGDGPYQEILRDCAKQLEAVLASPSTTPEPVITAGQAFAFEDGTRPGGSAADAGRGT